MTKTARVSPQVQFTTDDADAPYITIILDRAYQLGLFKEDRLSHEMDLAACYANGCPLNFKKLAAFDDFNFTHDFCGIWRHMDRLTGTLTGCFLPRAARPSQRSK